MLIALPWENLRPVPPLLPMIAAPVVLAWLSWHFIEAPLLRDRTNNQVSEDGNRSRPARERADSQLVRSGLEPQPQRPSEDQD